MKSTPTYSPLKFTKSSTDDFPTESLISVKQDSSESPNPPANNERKKEADFV